MVNMNKYVALLAVISLFPAFAYAEEENDLVAGISQDPTTATGLKKVATAEELAATRAALEVETAQDLAAAESAKQEEIAEFGADQTSMEDLLGSGYYVCRVPGAPRPEVHCNGCPRGTEMISFNPGNHARCQGGGGTYGENLAKTPGCRVLKSMKDMLWKRGNKYKWCKARGFEYIKRPGSSYRTGNYCFIGERAACAKDIG